MECKGFRDWRSSGQRQVCERVSGQRTSDQVHPGAQNPAQRAAGESWSGAAAKDRGGDTVTSQVPSASLFKLNLGTSVLSRVGSRTASIRRGSTPKNENSVIYSSSSRSKIHTGLDLLEGE